jgi:hypothetical protein
LYIFILCHALQIINYNFLVFNIIQRTSKWNYFNSYLLFKWQIRNINTHIVLRNHLQIFNTNVSQQKSWNLKLLFVFFCLCRNHFFSQITKFWSEQKRKSWNRKAGSVATSLSKGRKMLKGFFQLFVMRFPNPGNSLDIRLLLF